jgi:hypothetical protein
MLISLPIPAPHRREESAMARGCTSSRGMVLSAEEHHTVKGWQQSTTLSAGWGCWETSCRSWQLGTRTPAWQKRLASNVPSCGYEPDGFWPSAGWPCGRSWPRHQGRFPRAVAIHVVRLAGKRPALVGRRLPHVLNRVHSSPKGSLDCAARVLVALHMQRRDDDLTFNHRQV